MYFDVEIHVEWFVSNFEFDSSWNRLSYLSFWNRLDYIPAEFGGLAELQTLFLVLCCFYLILNSWILSIALISTNNPRFLGYFIPLRGKHWGWRIWFEKYLFSRQFWKLNDYISCCSFSKLIQNGRKTHYNSYLPYWHPDLHSKCCSFFTFLRNYETFLLIDSTIIFQYFVCEFSDVDSCSGKPIVSSCWNNELSYNKVADQIILLKVNILATNGHRQSCIGQDAVQVGIWKLLKYMKRRTRKRELYNKPYENKTSNNWSVVVVAQNRKTVSR